MNPEVPGEITALLGKWGAGDHDAVIEIASLAYDDLRSIAHSFLYREPRREAHTLQATALVNEFYLKLTQQRSPHFQSRAHFYHVAAMVMRRILTDYGRRSASQKRGTGTSCPSTSRRHRLGRRGQQRYCSSRRGLGGTGTTRRTRRALHRTSLFSGSLGRGSGGDSQHFTWTTVKRDVRFALAWLRDRVDGHGRSDGS